MPLALSIAVLRYRLYEIDLIINRTLVYGVLTTMLVGMCVASIVVLQGLLHALTGHESQLAIVASTLFVAALFNPLRRHEVRRSEDPGSLLRQAKRRDRPRCFERRPGGRGEGDDAACSHLFVATLEPITKGWQRTRVRWLAQRFVHPFGGVSARARCRLRVAVERNLYASVTEEVLNVPQ